METLVKEQEQEKGVIEGTQCEGGYVRASIKYGHELSQECVSFGLQGTRVDERVV